MKWAWDDHHWCPNPGEGVPAPDVPKSPEQEAEELAYLARLTEAVDGAFKALGEAIAKAAFGREQHRERMALMFEFGPGIDYDRERLIDEVRD